MKFRISVLILCLYACNSQAPGSKEAVSDTTGQKSVAKTASAASLIHVPTLFDKKEGYVLALKNDSLDQKLKIIYRNKKLIDFCLITTNTKRNLGDTLNGQLTLVEMEGDDESDNASDGAFYFYRDWNYTNKNGCQMDFRISIDDTSKYILVQNMDCQKLQKPYLPFDTKATLKRVAP